MSKKQKKIIILETDPARKEYLKKVLSREGYIAFCFDNIVNCFDNLDQLGADLLIIGPMAGGHAIRCIDALVAIKCRLPLLLISEDQRIHQYLATNQLNQIGLVDDTFDLRALRQTVRSAINKETAQSPLGSPSYLVGKSPEMHRIKRKIAELGSLTESVLISGEPGTGKEALARAIHDASTPGNGQFVKIDVSELRDDDSFSLLTEFRNRGMDPEGCNSRATNGTPMRWTIYLSEIGTMPAHLQAELLMFTGAANDDFRILAGTTCDTRKLVDENHLRQDLYYRLNVLNLKLPSLRHRREDISLLTDFFSYKFCREFDKNYLVISNRLKDLFRLYDWPGNVAELQDLVKRIVLKGEENTIISKFEAENRHHNQLKERDWVNVLGSIEEITNKNDYLGKIGRLSLKRIGLDFISKVERRTMRAALEATNWNRRKAASMLNISYKSMLNKIKAYGLAA